MDGNVHRLLFDKNFQKSVKKQSDVHVFVHLWDSFSRLPEVVLYKGKQNGFLRALLSFTVNGVEYTINRSFNIGDILLTIRSGDQISFKISRESQT